MISHRHKCVFVHIPKTGGTSIGTKLGLYTQERRGLQDHRPIRLLTPITASFLRHAYEPDHATVLYRRAIDGLLHDRDFLTSEQYERYFKFAFVRNPWARVYSWYWNVIADPVHAKDYDIDPDCSLPWFLRHRLETVTPQLDYLRGLDGDVAVDFIGRYEHLHRDFAFVCETLGIADCRLPERNRIATPLYVSEYDEASIAIVADRFREEIDVFGFRFGD